MPGVELISSTGVPRVDAILQGVIELTETRFPGRILCWYLGGSHSDGSGVRRLSGTHASDLDLFAVFREKIAPEEQRGFYELIASCNKLSPVVLDAHETSEHDLTDGELAPSILHALIKQYSLHLFGEDIRNRVVALDDDAFLHQVILHALFHMGTVRQRGVPRTFPLKVPMHYPIEVPDDSQPYFGYELSRKIEGRPVSSPGTRLIVAVGLWIASFYLVKQTGIRVGRKTEVVALYPSKVGDQWTPFVVDLLEICKRQWEYALPEDEASMQRLKEWCHQLLIFENQFLADLRPYLLEQLKSPNRVRRMDGLMNAMHILYRGEDFRAVLEPLTRSEHEDEQTLAKSVWERYSALEPVRD